MSYHYRYLDQADEPLRTCTECGADLLEPESVRVEIVTASLPDVLYAPVEAVYNEEGKTAAFVGMSAGIATVAAVWLATPIAWPWYAVIGSMTTLITGSLAAMLEPRIVETPA